MFYVYNFLILFCLIIIKISLFVSTPQLGSHPLPLVVWKRFLFRDKPAIVNNIYNVIISLCFFTCNKEYIYIFRFYMDLNCRVVGLSADHCSGQPSRRAAAVRHGQDEPSKLRFSTVNL